VCVLTDTCESEININNIPTKVMHAKKLKMYY
jgi:hypothetical protein